MCSTVNKFKTSQTFQGADTGEGGIFYQKKKTAQHIKTTHLGIVNLIATQHQVSVNGVSLVIEYIPGECVGLHMCNKVASDWLSN